MATQKVVVEGSSVTASQLKDLFRQIDDGSIGGSHMQAFIEHRDPWQNGHAAPQEQKKLLRLVTTSSVAAVENFSAKEKFKTRKTPDGVKLYWVGDNFTQHFLGKVEKNVAAATLNIHTLTESVLDAPILAELGEAVQETTLACLWELLKNQPQGESGPLLTNGYANILYIRDSEGTLWAVSAYWGSGFGWLVGAYSVGRPDGWRGGRRVVSR